MEYTVPNMSKTQEIKHPGIENPGNQCYFNSILQALASCNSIFKILINRNFILDKTKKLYININSIYNLL